MAFLKNSYHYLFSSLGRIFYRFPSRRIFVLGVTGTKGKSTVLELIDAIFTAAGKRTAVLSSARFKIAEDNQPNLTENTMPGRFFIQRFLRRAVDSGCEYVFLEVTSQGVLQYRHRFIDFDAALFLNLHPEHIEAHGSYESYRDTKARFFRDVAGYSSKVKKLFFINKNDVAAGFFKQAALNAGEIFYFSGREFLKNKLNGDMASLGKWFSSDFNLEDAAAAASFAETQGISLETIKKALKNFKGLPGRLEIIQEKPFRVVIDYAHTPDSLEGVYKFLTTHQLTSSQIPQLICVLGSAGGGRDKWKRPAFGKIASEYCSTIILTNEDSYDENPSDILNQIENGFSKSQISNPNFQIFKILDRKEAIKKAVSLAKPGDTVIITGKGSEPWIHVAKNKKISWNERQIVEEILRQID